MDNPQTTSSEHNPALNVFAILGFIALLIIGLWSVIQLVQQGSRLFSGMTTRASNSLSLSLVGSGVALALDTTNLTSGKPATVHFKVGAPADSVLAFNYACREQFYFEVQSEDGSAFAIPCNAPYAIDNKSTALTLVPVSDTTEKIQVPITMSLTPVDGKVITDSETVTVSPAASTTTETKKPVEVATPKPAPTEQKTETIVVPAPEKKVITKMVPVKKSDPTGLPDLTVKIVKIGVRNASGDVVEKSSFTASDAPVVEFEVANIGTKVASGWKFIAQLPTNPAYTYESPVQETLYAGAVANLSMSFDKLTAGTGIIRIAVDPQGTISEAVETNNGASRQIVVQ